MDVFDFEEERDLPAAKIFFKSRNGSKYDSFQTESVAEALEYSCYKDFKRDKAAILQREMPYLTKKQIEGKVKYMWTKMRNKAKVAQNGRHNRKAMGVSALGSRDRIKSRELEDGLQNKNGSEKENASESRRLFGNLGVLKATPTPERQRIQLGSERRKLKQIQEKPWLGHEEERNQARQGRESEKDALREREMQRLKEREERKKEIEEEIKKRIEEEKKEKAREREAQMETRCDQRRKEGKKSKQLEMEKETDDRRSLLQPETNHLVEPRKSVSARLTKTSEEPSCSGVRFQKSVSRVDSPEMETETRRSSSKSRKQEGVAKLSFSDVHFQEAIPELDSPDEDEKVRRTSPRNRKQVSLAKPKTVPTQRARKAVKDSNFSDVHFQETPPKVDSPDEDGKIRRTSPRNKKRESTGLKASIPAWKQTADVVSGSESRVQKAAIMCSPEQDIKKVSPQKKSKPTKSGSKTMNDNLRRTSTNQIKEKFNEFDQDVESARAAETLEEEANFASAASSPSIPFSENGPEPNCTSTPLFDVSIFQGKNFARFKNINWFPKVKVSDAFAKSGQAVRPPTTVIEQVPYTPKVSKPINALSVCTAGESRKCSRPREPLNEVKNSSPKSVVDFALETKTSSQGIASQETPLGRIHKTPHSPIKPRRKLLEDVPNVRDHATRFSSQPPSSIILVNPNDKDEPLADSDLEDFREQSTQSFREPESPVAVISEKPPSSGQPQLPWSASSWMTTFFHRSLLVLVALMEDYTSNTAKGSGDILPHTENRLTKSLFKNIPPLPQEAEFGPSVRQALSALRRTLENGLDTIDDQWRSKEGNGLKPLLRAAASGDKSISVKKDFLCDMFSNRES